MENTSCGQYVVQLADYFEPSELCGVAVRSGVETIAPWAMLAFQESYTILSYDSAYAFTIMFCRNILPFLAKIVLSDTI